MKRTNVGVLIALLLAAGPAWGELVSVRFGGHVTQGGDGCDPPWDAVSVGDAWSAVFTYETDTVDQNPGDPTRGFYPGAVVDIAIDAGAAFSAGAPTSSIISVFDNAPVGIDQFEVTSDLADGGSYGIFLQLDGTAPILPGEILPQCEALAPWQFDLATDMYIDDDGDIFDCRVRGEVTESSCVGEGTQYQCYRARDLKDPKFEKVEGVALADSVAATSTDLKKPFQVCLPVSRDGMGVPDRLNALCCYKQKAPKPKPAPELRTEDALGELSVQLKKPDTLCLPCGTRPPSPSAP